jgi:hypothetical protein
MFVRYGRAALTAAIMALAANAVRAQETCPAGGYYGGYAAPACCQKTSCCEKKSDCAASGCCKEGKCCKVEESCCKDAKCSTETKCPCCQLMSKLAKHTAIIMVMPSSMPLLGNCPLEAMGIVPHPPLPPGPHVMIPPPVLTPPGIPPHPIAMPMMPPPVPMPYNLVHEANTGNMGYGVVVNSNCGPCGSIASTCSPAVYCSTCVAARRVSTAPRLIAKPSNDQLEMSIGEDTSIRCKKMTVTIGEKEIALSIFDGRVRVRGEDLKASADSVRSDGKDRITLVGDVDLHYKNKESHSASVIRAGQVVVNLSSGTVTATQVEKPTTVPTGYAAPYSK